METIIQSLPEIIADTLVLLPMMWFVYVRLRRFAQEQETLNKQDR